MTGTEIDELHREPNNEERKELLSNNSLFRIKFDGSSYVIQKKQDREVSPNLWQIITGKRTHISTWMPLDKFGTTCIMILGSRFTWPEFYKTKEEAIKNIERWSFENEYFYPPDFH